MDGSRSGDVISLKRSEQQIMKAAGLNDDISDESAMVETEDIVVNPSCMAREEPINNQYYHERFDIIEIKHEQEDVMDNHVVEHGIHNEYQENENNNAADRGGIEDNNDNGAHDNDGANGNDGDAADDNSDGDHSPVESMVALLNEQFQDFADDQKLASAKLDRLIKMNEDLIKMKERTMQMREEQHAMDMALKRIDLEIKSMELRALKTKSISSKYLQYDINP